jgi:hypothetical protein
MQWHGNNDIGPNAGIHNSSPQQMAQWSSQVGAFFIFKSL